MEFIFLAVLLMVPVAYLILTVGQVQGGAYAVVGAADQAAKVLFCTKTCPEPTSPRSRRFNWPLRTWALTPQVLN